MPDKTATIFFDLPIELRNDIYKLAVLEVPKKEMARHACEWLNSAIWDHDHRATHKDRDISAELKTLKKQRVVHVRTVNALMIVCKQISEEVLGVDWNREVALART